MKRGKNKKRMNALMTTGPGPARSKQKRRMKRGATTTRA